MELRNKIILLISFLWLGYLLFKYRNFIEFIATTNFFGCYEAKRCKNYMNENYKKKVVIF